jgi:hypothetical protein
MPETIEHVNIMLEGQMPTLRHELKQRSVATRRLKTSDGQIFEIVYISSHGQPVETTYVHGHHSDNVVIMNADSPAKAKTVIGRVLGGGEFIGSNVLAYTKPRVFNQPHLQNLVQSVGRATRFGMVVEDEPKNITLTKLETHLKKWLAVWHQGKESRQKSHPPYLALRHRLSDETTGRLDGGKIAKLFSLSMAEMGTICGVSKQSFHANATSKGIQEKLEPLAKAAWGVLWCGGDESKFKTWLNQPNPDFPEYKGKQLSPLDMIRMGHAQVIADKVQNLLTGHPA